MLILTCCECGNEFEYRGYNYDPSKWNSFNKRCNYCSNRNFVRHSLERKNIVLDEQQFNEMYELVQILLGLNKI